MDLIPLQGSSYFRKPCKNLSINIESREQTGGCDLSPAETNSPTTPKKSKRQRKAPTAEDLAKKHKEISVAEFFERNKHILGFDSLNRALLTAVKEGVDNALDVCEEIHTMPDILVSISEDTMA